MPRLLIFGTLLMVAQVSSPQCGSSSSSSPTNNTVQMVVNGGPVNNGFNEGFVSVTVCAPGSTTTCQTIDGIVVDTGSEGLRIASSALRIALPQQTNGAGSAVVECLPFLDGVTWGPVKTADVKMAGEQANTIPIQVVGTDQFAIPTSCSSQGAPEETPTDLGANGILGIGQFDTDCGPDCAVVGASNPGLYYACSSASACQVTTQLEANQVINPVARFASDNNGVLIQLPAVPIGGQTSVTGALIFGIGTQSNNGLGNARVYTVDGLGNISTTFNGQNYPAFIDSGSNGIFFLDTPTTGLPACQISIGFYCPATLRTFSATTIGNNGASAVVSFNAGNVDAINITFSVVNEAAGANPGGFDWGLPFFYGRAVYTAIAGRSTPGGNGPYWAY